jgi:hypothetical protein
MEHLGAVDHVIAVALPLIHSQAGIPAPSKRQPSGRPAGDPASSPNYQRRANIRTQWTMRHSRSRTESALRPSHPPSARPFPVQRIEQAVEDVQRFPNGYRPTTAKMSADEKG